MRTSRTVTKRAASRVALAFVAGLLNSCTPVWKEVTLVFELKTSDASSEPRLRMQQLSFFVYQFELFEEKTANYLPVKLNAAPPWQSDRVALVQFANDPVPHNVTAKGKVQAGGHTVSGVRFKVGVPFDLNHADPLQAAAPLDRAEMYWTWQLGYKFMRVEIADQDGEWMFHLGSMGCSSASGIRPPQAACGQPNEITVELRGKSLPVGRIVIYVETGKLVAAMRDAHHVPCLGSYDLAASCGAAISMVGLDASTGRCATLNCQSQRLFALR